MVLLQNKAKGTRKKDKETKAEKQERKASEKAERQDKRADKKSDRQEKRADRKSDRADKKADKQEERADRKSDRAGKKADRQEERADRKSDKADKKAGKQEERADKKADRQDKRADNKADRQEKRADKKDERKAGKKSGWFSPSTRHYDTSDHALNKQETFYHFGNVSINYSGDLKKNCELHIIADNARLHTSDFNAKKDRDYSVSTQWLMCNSAKVIVTTKNRRETIFEIDVRKVKVDASSAETVKETCGEFTIEFSVFMNTDCKNRAEYQKKLFENSSSPGVWRNIDKTALLLDIENTVNEPTLVNQEDAGFCGATGLAYALASSQPHRLIQFCQELYESGSFKGAEKTFETSDKFRDSPAPRRLSLADYLFTGTLMEDAGWKKQQTKTKRKVDDNGNLKDKFTAEGNKSPGQKRWCREVLGYQNVERIGEKMILGKQIRDLVECNKKMKANGFVFLGINGDLIQPSMKKKPIRWINHWVTLEEFKIFDESGIELAVTSNNIKNAEELDMTVFSWGQDYSGRIPVKEYKKIVWQYVTCEPFKSTNVIDQLKDVK